LNPWLYAEFHPKTRVVSSQSLVAGWARWQRVRFEYQLFSAQKTKTTPRLSSIAQDDPPVSEWYPRNRPFNAKRVDFFPVEFLAR